MLLNYRSSKNYQPDGSSYQERFGGLPEWLKHSRRVAYCIPPVHAQGSSFGNFWSWILSPGRRSSKYTFLGLTSWNISCAKHQVLLRFVELLWNNFPGIDDVDKHISLDIPSDPTPSSLSPPCPSLPSWSTHIHRPLSPPLGIERFFRLLMLSAHEPERVYKISSNSLVCTFREISSRCEGHTIFFFFRYLIWNLI